MHGLRKIVPIATTAVVIGSVALALVAQASTHLLAFDNPTPRTSEYGPTSPREGRFSVGVRTVPREADRPSFTMWYPATLIDATLGVTYTYGVRILAPEIDTALATFEGRAVSGAPLATGTEHPLVILSHGFALTPSTYGWLAEHLASHGMVVVAPDHAETLDPGGLWKATIERPKQIRAVLADLEVRSVSSGEFHGVIDMSRIAIVGHSYGGYAALAVGGAELDVNSFQASCRQARIDDDPLVFLCDALEPHTATIADAAEIEAPTPGVDAVVSIAGDAAMFGESGLAEMETPVMVIGGTADTDTPYAWGPGLTFAHAGSPRKAAVALTGAGHLVFAGRCESVRRLLTVADLGFCSDPSWNRDSAQAVVEISVTAFLRSELLGDHDALAELGDVLAHIDGTHYESEGF